MEIELYQEMYSLERQHWWFLARRKILTGLISHYLPQGQVLDVGCGTGFILEELQKSSNNYNAWGLDNAEPAIAFCQQKKLTRITQGILGHDGLTKHSFDMVMFLDVIEHLDEDEQAVELAKDYLSLVGKLLITVPAYQFLWSAHDQIHGHKRRYTKKKLIELLHKTGYEVSYISYFNTFLFPLIAIARLLGNLRDRHQASDVSLPPSPVNQLLYQIFRWEKYFLPYLSFPFGVSIVCVAKPK
ncbi:MAG: class I SAM-dependent methyltransferase [Pseudanabaena sp.]|nr:MAG: class I SAM-dependent methyltransferase [Pseudanabaena sp.]